MKPRKLTADQIEEIARMRVHAFGHLAIQYGVQSPKADNAPAIRETTEITKAILLLLPEAQTISLGRVYTVDAKATSLGAGVYEIRFYVKDWK